MIRDEQDDFLLFSDSDYAEPRQDGKGGPAGVWDPPSWYNRADDTWWWREADSWQIDPCPVRALGMGKGDFVFVTAFGEDRVFTSSGLHGRGGLADLFVGKFQWLLRHFRKFDFEKKTLVGSIQREKALLYLIRSCDKAGPFDSSVPMRKTGIWRGPNDRPLVHSGRTIFYDDEVFDPGAQIGGALFLIGSKCQAPAHGMIDRRHFQWLPVGSSVGRVVAEHLDTWFWDSVEARDLFLGGLHCDMLCAALSWLPHKFVLAPYGSGKSALLRFARRLVGGSAHNVQQTYSKAYLEQNFAGNGLAFYLDETESDEEGARIRRIFELVRLLSDDGAEGGRGSSGGRKLATKHRLKLGGLLVKSQRTRWASCSAHHNLSLNTKLLFLSPDLFRYVVIHELCHTVHMNHGSEFWRLVASHEPSYKVLDQALRGAWKTVPQWVF